MEPLKPAVVEILAQIRGLVAKLAPAEKHEVIGELWDDLNDEHPDDIPIPDWQIEELNRRVAEYDAEPVKAGSRSMEEVIERIVSKHAR